MINGKKVLGIIPARGGSKGIPKKNIKLLGGKPLIFYTIADALRSQYIDSLIVSTDDKEIADISSKYGAEVPFLRPEAFATDTSKAIEVVRHALVAMEELKNCKFEVVVYLEPPSPLRSTLDIDTAIEIFINRNPDSVVSVVEVPQYHPILMKKITGDRLEPFYLPEPEGMPRQSYRPEAYMRNGAVYVIKRSNVLSGIFWGTEQVPYIMPAERSVNIDDLVDWYVAESFISGKQI